MRYQKPGNVYLGLVHRLDRPTGGVMVFAKTSKAASRLSEQVRSRSFGKVYLAVLHGVPDPEKGRLEHNLAKNRADNTVRVVEPSDPDGKHAILEYQVLDSKNSLSLVQVDLLTGRSHQIRVQFAATGHPLYGDQKHGAHKTGQVSRLPSGRMKSASFIQQKEGMILFLIPRQVSLEFVLSIMPGIQWPISLYIHCS